MTDVQPLADIHCHLVPGVDDGAKTLEDAIHYLREFASEGITLVVTTPHLPADPGLPERRRVIDGRFRELREAAAAALPGLALEIAYEIRLDDPEAELRDPGLGFRDGRLLVEFPMLMLPAYPERMLEVVLSQGRTPILAHPERYTGIERHYELVRRWRDMGTLLCLNAGSLLGEYGPEAQRVAKRMLAEGHADCIASDHHGRPARSTSLRRVYEAVARDGDEEAARLLMWANPNAIACGEPVRRVPPFRVNGRWLRRLAGRLFGGDR